MSSRYNTFLTRPCLTLAVAARAYQTTGVANTYTPPFVLRHAHSSPSLCFTQKAHACVNAQFLSLTPINRHQALLSRLLVLFATLTLTALTPWRNCQSHTWSRNSPPFKEHTQ